MSPRALPVDELNSYASRTGGTVTVQVRLRGSDLPAAPATVRLRAGRRTHDLEAQVTREGADAEVRFTVAADLGRHAWQLVLRPPSVDQPVPIQARLLAAPDQPVALLPGPKPATEMPPPPPRSHDSAARRVARRLPEPVKRPLRQARRMVASRGRS